MTSHALYPAALQGNSCMGSDKDALLLYSYIRVSTLSRCSKLYNVNGSNINFWLGCHPESSPYWSRDDNCSLTCSCTVLAGSPCPEVWSSGPSKHKATPSIHLFPSLQMEEEGGGGDDECAVQVGYRISQDGRSYLPPLHEMTLNMTCSFVLSANQNKLIEISRLRLIIYIPYLTARTRYTAILMRIEKSSQS